MVTYLRRTDNARPRPASSLSRVCRCPGGDDSCGTHVPGLDPSNTRRRLTQRIGVRLKIWDPGYIFSSKYTNKIKRLRHHPTYSNIKKRAPRACRRVARNEPLTGMHLPSGIAIVSSSRLTVPVPPPPPPLPKYPYETLLPVGTGLTPWSTTSGTHRLRLESPRSSKTLTKGAPTATAGGGEERARSPMESRGRFRKGHGDGLAANQHGRPPARTQSPASRGGSAAR